MRSLLMLNWDNPSFVRFKEFYTGSVHEMCGGLPSHKKKTFLTVGTNIKEDISDSGYQH
jgi:hypothetical protein